MSSLLCLALQGLFLRRQAQVSEEFSEFVVDNVLTGRQVCVAVPLMSSLLCVCHPTNEFPSNVLTGRQLWDELLFGARSNGFWRLLGLRIDTALGVAPDGGLPNVAGQGLYNLLGREDWEWLRREAVRRMKQQLPPSVYTLYAMTDESLALKETMVTQMAKLSSAEFERVLHPVFEEDEWTLILVGTALGGIAGAAQAACGV